MAHRSSHSLLASLLNTRARTVPSRHRGTGFRVRHALTALIVLASGCARPAVVSTPAPAPAPVPAGTGIGSEVVARTNDERAKLRVPRLLESDALMKAAQLHAEQMAALQRMAHELPGARYPSLGSRLEAVGYRMSASAENVAEGQPSAGAVVASWMTSDGHRANILSTRYTEMGAAMAIGKNGRRYWVQVFGKAR